MAPLGNRKITRLKAIMGGPTENWKGNSESMDRDGSLSGGSPSLPCCGGGVHWDKVRQSSNVCQADGCSPK